MTREEARITAINHIDSRGLKHNDQNIATYTKKFLDGWIPKKEAYDISKSTKDIPILEQLNEEIIKEDDKRIRISTNSSRQWKKCYKDGDVWVSDEESSFIKV